MSSRRPHPYLRLTAICVPLAVLLASPWIPPLWRIPELPGTAKHFIRLFTVHRASPSSALVSEAWSDRDTTSTLLYTRIGQILGVTPSGRSCYALVSFKDAPAEGGGDDDPAEDGADSDDLTLPSRFLCRLDLTDASIHWVSGSEFVRRPPRQRSLDRGIQSIAWISSPAPEVDPLTGELLPHEGPRWGSIWRFDRTRGRELVHTARQLTNRFVLGQDGSWAVYHSFRIGRTRAHVLKRDESTGEYAPPDGWSGTLDASIFHIFPGSTLALGALQFPRLANWSYTEFLIVDLATGLIVDRLDQADLRGVVRSSIAMASETAFAVQSSGEVHYSAPYSVVSLYSARPLRHMVTLSGILMFPTPDPASFIVLDSEGNAFFRDLEPAVLEAPPVLRAFNMLSGDETSLALGDFSPPVTTALTTSELIASWSSSLRSSPASPAGGLLFIPNIQGEPFCHIVDLRRRSAQPIPAALPMRSFLWSPSGRYLALSAAHLDTFTPDPEVAPPDPTDPAGLMIWDTQSRAVVFSSPLIVLPVRWTDDRNLLLFPTHINLPRPRENQSYSLYRYTAGEGLERVRPPHDSPAAS